MYWLISMSFFKHGAILIGCFPECDPVGIMSAFHRECNDPVGKQSTRSGKVTMFTSASSRPRHVGPMLGRRCINTRRPTLLCRFVVAGRHRFDDKSLSGQRLPDAYVFIGNLLAKNLLYSVK